MIGELIAKAKRTAKTDIRLGDDMMFTAIGYACAWARIQAEQNFPSTRDFSQALLKASKALQFIAKKMDC